MGLYDVPLGELVERAATELKKMPQLQPPEWGKFVKTGVHKERPPMRGDWWHVRAASMLRKLAILGPIGTSKLRRKYSGRRNRGAAPEHHYPGSGNIARKILQQLEKAGLAKQDKRGVHKGRMITPKGMSVLEKASNELMKEHNIIIPKMPAEIPKPPKTPKVAKPKAAAKPKPAASKPAKEAKPAKPRARKPAARKKPVEAPKPAEAKPVEQKSAAAEQTKEKPAEAKPANE